LDGICVLSKLEKKIEQTKTWDPENRSHIRAVILGCPFLATSNAIINCRNGVMNLSFENMTLEFNIFFNMSEQEEDDDETHDINIIDSFV